MYLTKRTYPKFSLLVLFPSLCSAAINTGVKGTKRPEQSPMETSLSMWSPPWWVQRTTWDCGCGMVGVLWLRARQVFFSYDQPWTYWNESVTHLAQRGMDLVTDDFPKFPSELGHLQNVSPFKELTLLRNGHTVSHLMIKRWGQKDLANTFKSLQCDKRLQVTYGVLREANCSVNRRMLRKGPGELKRTWNKVVSASEVQTALAAHRYLQAIHLLPVFLGSVAGPWFCLKPMEWALKTLVQTKDHFSNTNYYGNIRSTCGHRQ